MNFAVESGLNVHFSDSEVENRASDSDSISSSSSQEVSTIDNTDGDPTYDLEQPSTSTGFQTAMVRVKLYHFSRSGPSRGALLAARQVGVDVNIQIVDLFNKEQLQPEFIKINPQHTVPTLVDGDFALWDGHAIATYLVNRYSTDDSLYPRDSKQRAVVDHRLFFDVGVLYNRIRDICFPVLFRGVTEVSAEKIKSLEEALGWVNMFLGTNPWVAGSELTIADTAFLASISSIVAVGYNITKYPQISEWLKRCEMQVKGWAENQEGAALFGEAVRSKLKPGQFQ